MATEKEKTPKKTSSNKVATATNIVKESPQSATKKATVKKAVTKKAVAAETPIKPVTEKQTEKVTKKKTSPKAGVKVKVKSSYVSVSFQLIYATNFGQSIYIVGNQQALGAHSDDKAVALTYVDQSHWAVNVQLDKKMLAEKGLNYYYIIKNEDGSFEKSASYQLEIPSEYASVNITDAWNFSGYEQNAFSSDVFKVLTSKTIASIEKSALKKGTHQFKVKAPQLAPHHVVCILGDMDKLNNWNPEKAILLFPDKESGFWKVNLTITERKNPVQYKYGIYDIAAKTFVAFEEGENRQLLKAATEAKNAILNDGFFRTN